MLSVSPKWTAAPLLILLLLGCLSALPGQPVEEIANQLSERLQNLEPVVMVYEAHRGSSSHPTGELGGRLHLSINQNRGLASVILVRERGDSDGFGIVFWIETGNQLIMHSRLGDSEEVQSVRYDMMESISDLRTSLGFLFFISSLFGKTEEEKEPLIGTMQHGMVLNLDVKDRTLELGMGMSTKSSGISLSWLDGDKLATGLLEVESAFDHYQFTYFDGKRLMLEKETGLILSLEQQGETSDDWFRIRLVDRQPLPSEWTYEDLWPTFWESAVVHEQKQQPQLMMEQFDVSILSDEDLGFEQMMDRDSLTEGIRAQISQGSWVARDEARNRQLIEGWIWPAFRATHASDPEISYEGFLAGLLQRVENDPQFPMLLDLSALDELWLKWVHKMATNSDNPAFSEWLSRFLSVLQFEYRRVLFQQVLEDAVRMRPPEGGGAGG